MKGGFEKYSGGGQGSYRAGTSLDVFCIVFLYICPNFEDRTLKVQKLWWSDSNLFLGNPSNFSLWVHQKAEIDAFYMESNPHNF